MPQKSFGFWAGPCAVKQVAERLAQDPNLRFVWPGTERVHFLMSEVWEQAAGETLRFEAQRVVDRLYPTSHFTVYEE